MAKDLTTAALMALSKELPAARRETPDGNVRGLYFVQQPTGAASWAFRYRINSAPRKLTLGSYPALDLKNARDNARKAAAAVANGFDPAAAKIATRKAERAKARARARDEELVEHVVASFVERYAKKNTREASWRETERVLGKEVTDRWKGRRLAEIKRSDIHTMLDDIVDRGSPIMANRALAAVRRMFNWAVERGIIETSPCDKVKSPAAERSRDRILTDDELRLAWLACDDIGWPFGAIVKLLVLTGQRRDEIAAMRWSEVDLVTGTWTIPRDRAKNDVEHIVPLPSQAVSILKSVPKVKSKQGFVFTITGETAVSGFTRAKDRLDKFGHARLAAEDDEAKQLPHWTLHDLRRTAASGMARLGIALPIIEKLLNHVSGSFGGIVSVYQRHTFADEKKLALEAWGRHVEGLIGSSRANVVELRKAL